MSVTTSQIAVANQEQGTLTAQTNYGKGLEIKNVHTNDGEQKTVIEGYVATTHLDQGRDKFTKTCLDQMAGQIRNDAEQTVDTVFPEIDGMSESQIGNLNHNNNPAAEKLIGVGDTRTVSTFKTVHAETHLLDDGETGLYIKAEMLPLPENVADAVKGQIKEGALHSFSIEFKPSDVEFEVADDGEPQRTIKSAEANGAALTGRPMNEMANVTDAELKNIMRGKTMTENDTETAEENVDSPEPEADVPEGDEPEETEAEGETEEVNEPEEEVEEPEAASEAVEVKNDVKELKSMFKDIKEENEELKNENEELKSQLEDFKTIKDIKSEITELKSAIEASDEDLEDEETTPQTEEEDGREVKNDSGEQPQWQKVIDQLGMDEHDLKSNIGSKGMTEAESIAETHGVKVEEVMEYAK